MKNRRIVVAVLPMLLAFFPLYSQSDNDTFIKAVAAGDVVSAREMLRRSPALAHIPAPGGSSILLYALYHQQPEIASLILPLRRSDLNVFESAATGETARLHTLLNQNPPLASSFSEDGFTALHLASFFGQTAAQVLLLDAGADINAISRNALKATPLQSAVAARQIGSASVLLAYDANPNCRGENGYTPLFEAAAGGQVRVVKLLLHYGADPTVKGEDGRTALDVAVRAQQRDTEQILTKRKRP